MRISRSYIPLIKENPSDATVVSHRLMLRSGMIKQISQGIYTFLPLGSIVLRKISDIIRKNLDKIGCNEIVMSTIQPAELWMESGRYDDYGDEMLRIKDRHGKSMLYGPTNEEVVTYLFRSDISSYRALPVNLYQIQWKFRDEIRPRFGLMRGREFLMMDAYSFDLDEEAAKKTYFMYYNAYLNIFKDLGLFAIPMKAPSGPIGGDLSHEFHIVADTGESSIFYDQRFEEMILSKDNNVEKMKSLYAAADEEHNPSKCEGLNIREKRGIEVGHIFYFDDKYSKAMGAFYTDKNGNKVTPKMGSYGIGVSRLIAAAIEASHDKDGIIWPKEISPYQCHLINLDPKDEKVTNYCDDLYDKILNHSSVLYDDSEASVGVKFANADLIGIPYQVIVGKKRADSDLCEIKNRKTGERIELPKEETLNFLIKNCHV